MSKKKKKNPIDILMNQIIKKKRQGNQLTESLWNPYTDGVTYSLLSKFTACRERTRLSYVEGWTSKNFNVPLEFGNIFHLLKEWKYSGKSMDETLKIANSYIEAKISRRGLTATAINELQCLKELVVVTFKEYVKFWEKNPTFSSGNKSYCDKDIIFKNIERKFKIPWTLSNNKIITLTGKIDGELIDPVSKKYRVLENKTKQRIDEVDIETLLKNDMQTTMYLLGNRETYGSMPDGVIYNVVRRTSLKPRKDEDSSSYSKRIGSDIRSRPDFYFMRWKVDISETDLNRFVEKSLDPLLCQLVMWWESIKDNPFDPWRTRSSVRKSKKNELHYARPFGMFGGTTFDIANEFKEIVVNEDHSEYEQRKVCFPELEDDECLL